jgi:hypothetical protein
LYAVFAVPEHAHAQPQLEPYRVVTLSSGWTIATYRPSIGSQRIVGADSVVRFTPSGVIDLMRLRPIPEGEPLLGGALDAAAAQRLAASVAGERASMTTAAPVLVARGDRLVPAFDVRLGRSRVLIDAQDGSVLGGALSLSPALGRVFDPNPVVAMSMTDVVELEGLLPGETLTGERIHAASCTAIGAGDGCTSMQLATANIDGDFLFEPDEPSFGDPFAEVNAYFHADRAARYFADRHGLTWDCCGTETALGVFVSYSNEIGTPFPFSFYRPNDCEMTRCGNIQIGQGETQDLAYDGDVLYHEHAHAIVDERTDNRGFVADELGASYQPSAVEEAVADYFAATIGGDPLVAEYLRGLGTRPEEDALRSLDNDLSCPQDLFGEGHQDGRILGAAMWEIREALGAELADELVMASVLVLGEQPILGEASEALLVTAESMRSAGRIDEGQLSMVRGALEAHGLGDCDRIVTLTEGQEHEGYSGQFFPTASFGSVAPIHYRVDVPEDMSRVRVELRPLTERGRYSIAARLGDPVLVLSSLEEPIADTVLPVPVDTGGSVVFDAARSTPLFLAVVTEDLELGSSHYAISAEPVRAGEPDCSCSTAPLSSRRYPRVLLLCGLLVLVLRRR